MKEMKLSDVNRTDKKNLLAIVDAGCHVKEHILKEHSEVSTDFYRFSSSKSQAELADWGSKTSLLKVQKITHYYPLVV